MECVSQLVGAFLTFAPEMLDLSGGPLFRRRARAWIIGVLRTGFRGLRGDRPLCVPWIAPACEGAMSFPRSQCISTRFLESPGVHFGHLVHQTFKNENTLREDCMRRSCSCIQKRFRKFWPERQAVPNGVNGEKNASSIIRRCGGGDSHRRRSLCAGNAPIALQRRELSCRSNVA